MTVNTNATPDAPALLQLRNFSVSYGPVEAVHQINLEVKRGEIVTVIGPNGAGKTTLLCAAMGLLPARGEIALDGTPVVRCTVEKMVAQSVALVVKASVKRVGSDASKVSGHSLRAGYCTSAAEKGLQPWQIREQTGHKSDVTLARYIRPVERRKIPSLL